MNNPLLENAVLPPFGKIQATHVEPAIEELIASNLKAIDVLTADNFSYTWENLIWPLEELEDKLSKAWSAVSHLNSVVNTPELRQAHHHCVAKLADYSTKVGQNQKLYAAYQALKNSAVFATLTPPQQKVITDALLEFELAGVALATEQREKFAALSQQLAKLESKFQDNVMDATDHWHFDTQSLEIIKGIPPQTLELAKQNAEKAGVKGWRFTLDFPCYQAVMMYAESEFLRQKMHQAYFTRASSQGEKPEWDNSKIMEEILTTRLELAKLLGFNNFAECSLAKKMAKTPTEVINFLRDLAQKTKPFAEQEFNQLKEFIQKEYGIFALSPWDMAYYSEKLRQKNFALSQETLRPYFSLPTVLNGMFEVVKRLYGLSIKEVENVEKWHKDVRFFEIYDKNQQRCGMFYLDLFARNNKRGGAWMDECRVRRRLSNGELQYPVAYLTCNFREGVGELPPLLTHEEVLTLFHEFGHGLHHMLTKMEYAAVSGINGVPWDAVELPSQFMENWCWQKEALTFLSSHYQTHEPLSASLLEKMHQAKNFQAGMKLLRQLEFALFDFRIHLECAKTTEEIQAILEEIRQEFAVVPSAAYMRFQHSFSHIFSGGYAAGYYSYLWAEVLACDAFSKFEEEGIFNQATGSAFLAAVLQKGGSEDPTLLFRTFRGREPQLLPFLRQHGLKE